MLFGPLIKRFRQAAVWLISRKHHHQGFRFVAKIGPVPWLTLVPALYCYYGIWILDHVTGGWTKTALFLVGGLMTLWLTLFWFVAPDVNNRGVLCNVERDRGMSVHLEGAMSSIALEKGASSALDLARQIGAMRIDLYSPLFGRAKKEKLWLDWLKKTVHQLAPGAKVEVAHRDPLSWYASFLYRCQYGTKTRATEDKGRVPATCFRITAF
jgi:hypothetical protein